MCCPHYRGGECVADDADVPTRDPVDGLSLVVAANARSLRARARLRQRDVAEKAGIQASTLSLIEGERRRITLDDALALCRGLDVGLADLLTGATTDDLTTLRMTGN
jgi:transcriptional regulator with XRE-family HTH domain